MDKKKVKFKTRKVYNTPGHSHFLTFSTLGRRPYLTDARVCRLLAGTIANQLRRHKYVALAYVLMPDHVHILVHPLEEIYDISDFLKSIKQGVSSRALNNGWIETPLWEAGGGYDRNITGPRSRRFVINYIHQNPVKGELVDEMADYVWSSANWSVTGKIGSIPCVHFASLER